MMMPHIMELLKTVRLSHKITLAKNMLQDETSSIDKASSHDEAMPHKMRLYFSIQHLYSYLTTLSSVTYAVNNNCKKRLPHMIVLDLMRRLPHKTRL